MNCKHLSRYVVVLVAAMFVLAVGVTAIAATESKDEKILEKVSKEAGTAMRDVRFARVAIFDGQPEAGEKLLDSAKKNLTAAEKNAPEQVVTVKSKQKVGDKTVATHEATQTTEFVPIDAWLGLSEDFVPSPEKQKKIKEANEHLKKGESAKAVEVLREADIGVSVTRVLMPLKATVTQVDKAIELIKEHKYYEANLSLKAAEDGLITDSILLYEPVTPEKKK
jgi:glucan-binding YG repeat protein